jgi:argininosuccinate lyase
MPANANPGGPPGRSTLPEDLALEVGGRLERGPSERLVQSAFSQELESQAELFEAMGLADLAHTLVMMEAGIVPPKAGRELIGALLRLQERPADFVANPAGGDLYTNREAWLNAKTDASVWLGAGRARREATTTAFLMKLREALLGLAEALAAAGRTFTARARDFESALMPDYTYLLSAQPTCFGHYLLGFAYPMLRDLERIRALYARVNQSPAGCGSVNGSRLPQSRERLRQLLGFDALTVHARDAIWRADLPIETVAALTAILVNLDRLAEDLQILSTEEFALIELHDSHARASKIMPQKKNPYALTHVRGLANTMIGTIAASAALGRTPSAQPDNRLRLYGMIPRALADTRNAVELMGEVVEWLSFNAPRGRTRLNESFAIATDLAETLVLECGLDFRQAHRLVGFLVRRHLTDGSLDTLTPEELAATSQRVLGRRIQISQAALSAALDPETALPARSEPGGAAPAPMAAMFAECEAGWTDAMAWCGARRKRLLEAETALLGLALDCRSGSQGNG